MTIPRTRGALVGAAALALTIGAAAPAGARPAVAATAGRAAPHGPAVTGPAAGTTSIPDYSHVVVVIEENKAYGQIIGKPGARYINSLAAQGALFTESYGITYPSQPNYLALFAGSTFGLASDNCPYTFSAANLGSELLAAGLTYSGYSESMPSQGYEGCRSGKYWRKHNPTADFTNVPAADNNTFAAFPADYADLPTVSFVDPNLVDDMHSGPISGGDAWLQDNMNGYIQWAKTHNSLFILTWDTDNRKAGNHIPTLFVGAHIKPGDYAEHITHYNVLRTLEQAYGLPYAGQSASAAPITDVFTG